MRPEAGLTRLGLPLAAQSPLFGPILYAEGDRNRERGSVGLGLAIARRAVAIHGGQIAARDAEPGLSVEIALPGPCRLGLLPEIIPFGSGQGSRLKNGRIRDGRVGPRHQSVRGRKSVPLLIPKSKSRSLTRETGFGTMGRSEDPMLIGYARVSTADQKLDLQDDALTKAGCERIFTDTAGGAGAERTGLEQALGFARKGDTLVVWKLDRLGRSLRHLVETLAALRERGIGFRSLRESIDTTTSGGKLVFHVFAALAEFERDLIRERTRAGLEAARARGKRGGRRPKLDAKKRAQAIILHRDESNTIDDICRTLRVGRSTLYRCLAEERQR
jgi:DNA invertase Pin-like site-specific DNA recombinase